MTQWQQFLVEARALVGKARWRHRGRKPWAVDCAGLILHAFRQVGVAEGFRLSPSYEVPYGREPWDDMLRRALAERFGVPFPLSQARPADIALMRWRPGEPSHLAIIGDHPHGGLSLIHAHNLSGVVEHAIAPPFDRFIVEVYRPWPDTSSL